MSGATIPYQLRPNKYIDRQLFIDLLGRMLPDLGNEKFVYVSMGGKHLTDHGSVYRQVGIPNLLSIDNSEDVVARQRFNKPIARAECWELDSGKLPGKIDAIFEKFGDATNLVVWLDYTKAKGRLTQLQELVQVLSVLQPGDLLRITMNADYRSLGNEDAWRKGGFETPKAYRLDKLKKQLGTFVPVDLPEIGDADLPDALVQCIALAASSAEAAQDIKVTPLLLTSYRDGQRMVTATMKVVAPEDAGSAILGGLGGWPFCSRGWSGLVWIEAPDLSLREKQKIDQYLDRSPSYILDRLKFLPAEDREASLGAIRSYKRLHRYYPEFRHVPV